MKLEELEAVLVHPNIILVQNDSTEGFNRDRKFIVGGVLYTIEWWCNICYLHSGNLQIPFHSVERSGTWPNRAKTNLQFYYHKEVCCILPIERY